MENSMQIKREQQKKDKLMGMETSTIQLLKIIGNSAGLLNVIQKSSLEPNQDSLLGDVSQIQTPSIKKGGPNGFYEELKTKYDITGFKARYIKDVYKAFINYCTSEFIRKHLLGILGASERESIIKYNDMREACEDFKAKGRSTNPDGSFIYKKHRFVVNPKGNRFYHYDGKITT